MGRPQSMGLNGERTSSPCSSPTPPPSPAGFSHRPFLGLVRSPNTVRCSWQESILGGAGIWDLTGWVSSSGRNGFCTDQGHQVTGAQEEDCGKEDSSGRGGLGRSHLHLTHLTSPASQLLSRARGVPSSLRRPAQAPMELPMAT